MRQRIATPIAVAALVAVVAVVGSTAGPALAHAPPLGTGLWWIPSPSGAAGERLVIRTPRGFLFQSSGSAEMRFLCNEAVGIQDNEEASFADAEGEALLLTTFARGLLRGSMDACRWAAVTSVTTGPTFDVAVTASGPGGPPQELVVGGVPNGGDHFWAGRESGTVWSTLANSDMPYTRVRVAPGEPSRIYLTGIGVGATGMAVHRLGVSRDAGKTIVDEVITLGPTDLQARVLGVDPLRPDHLYLRVESNSVEIPERLLVSQDGGRSFITGPTLHEIQGFSQSDDGSAVWVGGTEGIYRSTDGGGTFVAPPSGGMKNITCLAFHQNHLYACGVLDNQLVVAISDDGGDSFRKVLSFEQVTQALDCPQSAPTDAPAAVCAQSLEHWRAELGTTPAPDAGPPAPPATGTGGAAGAASAGCSLGGEAEGADARYLLALVSAFALRRLGRRRLPRY